MNIKFRISAPTLDDLNEHLFPGDGKEAVAFILCGHLKQGNETILLAHKVVPLSYDSCPIREYDRVHWLTSEITPILIEAEKNNLAIVKVHCHPSGYSHFSNIDNESDRAFFPSIYNWLQNDLPGLSVIMLPNNKLIVRHVSDTGLFAPVNITVINDKVYQSIICSDTTSKVRDFEQRNLQVFGSKTKEVLNKMKVAVIGCSGTGSPIVEQLYRLGIGELILIDPDIVEYKNLNRITNSKYQDAENNRFKVNVLKTALDEIGLGSLVKAYSKSIFDNEMIREIASCDFIFGCVDSAEARCLLNQISNYYLVPYIDIGISLDADGLGGVTNISGKIAYFQPGKSDHLSRKSVLPSTLEAEALKRSSPSTYQDRLEEGYIKGVNENSPAIIPVNTYASSLAIMEFLARLHNFRNEPDNKFAEQVFCFVNNFFETKDEKDFNDAPGSKRILGRGDTNLLLGMPEFGIDEKAA